MGEALKAADVAVGVVGLGLMGSSIVVSLLSAGHTVIGIAPVAGEREVARVRIREELKLCEKDGLLRAPWMHYLPKLTVSEDYRLLSSCSLVLECVTEQMEIKEAVYHRITAVTSPDTIIASNTSAIPISVLQERVPFPGRFIGIHWSEPAFATRFMEITCGDQTTRHTADRVSALAARWGKEPTVLRKDIRGFITNRLMYAVYREAFALVEHGVATLSDVDKSFRYEEGSWMTLMGIFRRMDFLGLEDYAQAFARLLPQLDNSGQIPPLMERLVGNGSGGAEAASGLYEYAPGEAEKWKKAFARFIGDIHQLARQYPSPALETVPEDKTRPDPS